MSFNFGEVLTRAWQITWKYKVLWIFGILASCARGGGGGSGGSSSGSGNGNGNWDGNTPPIFREWERSLEQAAEWMVHNWWIFIIIGLVFLALIVLSIFLGNMGRIGLIRGTLQAENGAEKLSFGELFSGSLPYFWRVFGLSFIIGLIVFAAIIPFLLFGVLTAGVGFLCILPLICILIPVGIAVNLTLELADVAIVRDNAGMWEGWQRGWNMARANIGPVIGMALILFVIGLGVSLVIAIPLLIVLFPTMIGFMASNGENMTPLIIAGVCFAAFLPISILAGGILNTYIGSAWTLTYLRLTPAALAPMENNAPVPSDEPQA